MTISPKPCMSATFAATIWFLAVASFWLGVGHAFAQTPVPALSGFYISGELGGSITNDPVGSDGYKTELSPGFVVGGAFGYEFGRFTVEGEIFHQGYDVDDQTKAGVSRAASLSPPLFGSQPEVEGTYSALATMLNGYVALNPSDEIRLFLGAGIGMARIESEIKAVSRFIIWSSTVETIVNDSDTVFAYQAMAGMLWPITRRIDLIFKYRYFATEDPTFTDYTGATATQDGMQTHAITFGARYKF